MPETEADELPTDAHLQRMARELATLRRLMVEVIQYIREAESEVPEKMRRFMNYMHDVHDVKYMYEELGVKVPDHLLRELERVDDRFRQLIAEQNAEGGVFAKVRREMASDKENRWDHTRQLPPPTHEVKLETGKSDNVVNGLDESGAKD